MSAVFVNQKYILFLQDFGITEKHKHDICHLTISLKGKMHCRINTEIVDCYGYILNSNVYHERFGKNADSTKLGFIFEPCISALLSIKMNNKNYIELNETQYNKIINLSKKIVGLTNNDNDWKGYLKDKTNNFKTVINEILNIAGIFKEDDYQIDERVGYLINRLHLEETVENSIIDEACSEIGLSKSRMLHLFKETTGVSLKKYMQNIKFFKTWEYIASGENITKACIHAGYSDSAHYSNFMNQCYGLSTKKELMSVNGVYILN